MKSLLSKIATVSAGLTLLLALASCQKPQDNTLPLPAQTVVLGHEAGSQGTVSITFNGNWNAECQDNRFSVSPLSGNGGDTEITVTAETANPGLGERTSSFTVTDAETGNASVYIVQKGTPQIRPAAVTYSASASASSIAVEIDANTELTYSENVDWIGISATGISDSTLLGDGRTYSDSLRHTLTLSLDENTGDGSRSAVLTLSAEGVDDVEIP